MPEPILTLAPDLGSAAFGRNQRLFCAYTVKAPKAGVNCSLDLQRQRLTHAPDLAIGDGALGFWNTLRAVFGATKDQPCRFHKTGNVLNAMPKSAQT